jgi:hypothetical protein
MIRAVEIHYACSLPRREYRVMPVLVLIIILVVYTFWYTGNRAMLVMVFMAVLTAAADELVRAAILPAWSRTA